MILGRRFCLVVQKLLEVAMELCKLLLYLSDLPP